LNANVTGPGLSPPPESGSDHLPAPFDPRVPHPARVYAYWLGGKDHCPADRAAGQEVARLRPEVVAAARANRAFGYRVTGHAAAGLGIRQFLDIGAGLPAPGPTHETAQKISPACRVVYVDNDPLVLAHGRALLTARPGAQPCAWLHGDVRDPAAILEQAAGVLDFTRPVAVLLLALLHFVADDEDPAGIVAQFAAALAPGSLIAISHLTGDFAPQAITDSAAAYNARVPIQVHPRSRDQITALCGALPVPYPGVVPVNHWMPSLRESPGSAVDLHAAVIRLPRPEPLPGSTATARCAGEAAALEQVAARFPDHQITREMTGAGPAYVAQARNLTTSPYLVMTSTLVGLCARLDPGGPPAS
jgi:S-adenosyl methyltransferase